jgi:hypothetical protein
MPARLLRGYGASIAIFGTGSNKARGTELFKEGLIYEQSAARTVCEQQESRTFGWSRQPLKIEQLQRRPSRHWGESGGSLTQPAAIVSYFCSMPSTPMTRAVAYLPSTCSSTARETAYPPLRPLTSPKSLI